MTNTVGYGPILSGKIESYLVETESISSETARKRIERLESPIHKIRGYFADGQSFLYHSSIYNTELFYAGLKSAFEKAGKRYSSIITAMNYHNGVIAAKDLANYSFSPVMNTKGHVTFETIIGNLIKLNALYLYDEEHYQLNSYMASAFRQLPR